MAYSMFDPWLRLLKMEPQVPGSNLAASKLLRVVNNDHQDRETHARRRQINKMKEIHVIDEDDGPSTEFDRQDDDYLDMVPENDVQMRTNDLDDTNLDDDEDNAEDEFQENWDGEDDWENNDFDNVNYGDNEFDENDDNDWL
nr:ciliogenesis-associated TTC17-interacting protein-like [Coffea arabica]